MLKEFRNYFTLWTVILLPHCSNRNVVRQQFCFLMFFVLIFNYLFFKLFIIPVDQLEGVLVEVVDELLEVRVPQFIDIQTYGIGFFFNVQNVQEIFFANSELPAVVELEDRVNDSDNSKSIVS